MGGPYKQCKCAVDATVRCLYHPHYAKTAGYHQNTDKTSLKFCLEVGETVYNKGTCTHGQGKDQDEGPGFMSSSKKPVISGFWLAVSLIPALIFWKWLNKNS